MALVAFAFAALLLQPQLGSADQASDKKLNSTIYDIHRQAYSHSLVAGTMTNMAAQRYGGLIEDALQKQAQMTVSAYLSVDQSEERGTLLQPNEAFREQYGSWELVWGPGITSEVSGWMDTISNGMYVAYSRAVRFPSEKKARPTYMVAVGAANPTLQFRWTDKHLRVSSTVKFEGWNATTAPEAYNNSNYTIPLISMGTAIGLHELMTTVSPPSSVAPNQTLAQFLKALNPKKGSALIFTGHSLAGTLCPPLALSLKMNGVLAAFDRVFVYPQAGTTPGNNAFANLFNAHFPPTRTGTAAYQVWNANLYNRFDAVPHAWGQETLSKIPLLYGNADASVLDAVTQTVAYLQDQASRSHIEYVSIANQSLPGELFTMDPMGQPISLPPRAVEDFSKQMLLQHVHAYVTQPGNKPGLILEHPLPVIEMPYFLGVYPLI